MDPESEAPTPAKKPRARKPLTAEELCTRGYSRLDRSRKADARADFLRATELDPQNDSAWFGLALAATDDLMRRDSLQRALALNPSNEQARDWLEQYERLETLRAQLPPVPPPPAAPAYSPPAPAPVFRPAPVAYQPPPSSQESPARAGFIAAGILLLVVVVFSLMGAFGSRAPAPAPYVAPPRATVRAAPTSGPVYRTGAVCNDGTISSATGSGACSRHDGVDHWLYSK
jgi:hypothetical protein